MIRLPIFGEQKTFNFQSRQRTQNIVSSLSDEAQT